MASIGYGKTKLEIPLIVKEILDNGGEINGKFKGNLPSDSWVYSFLKRHPSISSRIPEPLGTARASVTRGKIKYWFVTLKNFMIVKFGIDPDTFFNNNDNCKRIFNLDETGFPLAGKGA